jgi:hypothetical protein
VAEENDMHKLRTLLLVLLVVVGAILHASPVGAQIHEHGTDTTEALQTDAKKNAGAAPHGDEHANSGTHSKDGHGAGHGKKSEEKKSPFDPHAGTWVNPIARLLSGQREAPKLEKHGDEVHVDDKNKIRYDYIVIAGLVMAALGLIGASAGRKAKVRPEGKPHSMANMVEAACRGVPELPHWHHGR